MNTSLLMERLAPTATARLVSLHLNRFAVEARLVNQSVCGGYDGNTFGTEVSLIVDSLDSDGFVIENGVFVSAVRQNFADGTYKASCEMLADGVVAVASTMLGERLLAAEVTVFGVNAHITVLWQKGQPVPKFPPLATAREIKESTKQPRSYGGC